MAANALTRVGAVPRQFMARLVFAAQGVRQPLGLALFQSATESGRVGYDPATETFFVDRRSLQPVFAGQSERHDAARVLDAADISLEVWADGGTLEVFADGGTVLISDRVYPDPAATGLAPFSWPGEPGAAGRCAAQRAVNGVLGGRLKDWAVTAPPGHCSAL